ncbi:DNA repair exonuclease [Roseiconus nitratireducens]|uniref:DNA repair exonuclease n=1 Tax=Roseiconus nitratireducens TaxID=2605748 RepID=A0A5M6D0S3_9BACT|nr:DNA repair exonuclease [Roseiconus nitratireducens]KAA5541044.1 DNA repair exonuclease [Roseiconus nitratireducens]
MPGESFRFIHASDFHLERPLGDLDELPPPLRDKLASAPHDAVRAVFDAALSNNIDFVVLSGDLLHPQAAGPYGMNFLLEQFQRLHDAETPVYWAAGGADDPQKWPEACAMPPNVTLFSKDHPSTIEVSRGGRTICRVVGRSTDGRASLHVPGYQSEASDEFTIGIGHGDANLETLSEARFDFWCLGGKHNREELESEGEVAALYSGTPQGRSLGETGPHGFSIVDVDAELNLRVHEMPTDVFRYCQVRLDAADIAAVGTIHNLMGERLVRLEHEAGGRNLIIGWEIVASNGESLSAIGDPEELLQWVRREYGHGAPAAWSTRLRVRPPQKYPKSWHEEDTILGDYLRVAAEHRKKDSAGINLLPMTEEHPSLATTATSLLAEVPETRRQETLDQATLIGVELLRGGKPQWVQTS